MAKDRHSFNPNPFPGGNLMDRIDLGTDKKTGMAAFALTMLAIFLAWAVRPVQAQTLKVGANYEISGAGYKAVTTSDGRGLTRAAGRTRLVGATKLHFD
jgi:hypothetical protein